jgi:hypothetical protein
MAPVESPTTAAQPPLVDSLLQYGKLGFNPESSEETRHLNQTKFNAIIERYYANSISFTFG